MNELSSTQQDEYHHNDQIQHQMNQGNVSSFYNDDIDEIEERKEDGLRIPNRSESERPTEARNFRGGKDIEL